MMKEANVVVFVPMPAQGLLCTLLRALHNPFRLVSNRFRLLLVLCLSAILLLFLLVVRDTSSPSLPLPSLISGSIVNGVKLQQERFGMQMTSLEGGRSTFVKEIQRATATATPPAPVLLSLGCTAIAGRVIMLMMMMMMMVVVMMMMMMMMMMMTMMMMMMMTMMMMMVMMR